MKLKAKFDGKEFTFPLFVNSHGHFEVVGEYPSEFEAEMENIVSYVIVEDALLSYAWKTSNGINASFYIEVESSMDVIELIDTLGLSALGTLSAYQGV